MLLLLLLLWLPSIGTCFGVSLSLIRHHCRVSSLSFLGAHSHRIMLVDDEAAIRDSVGQLLESQNYTVQTFADGSTALNELLSPLSYTENNKYSAIISDIRMPGLDGLQFLETIRQLPQVADLPVILLTAKGRPDDRVVGYKTGADAYVPKPFDPDELLSILANVIDKHQSVQQTILVEDLQKEIGEIKKLLTLQQQQNSVYLVDDEKVVLEYLVDGHTNKEIASKLFLSTRKIEQLISVLFRKTSTRNRTELIRWAIASGTVPI